VRLDEQKADPSFYFYYLQSHHGQSAIRSIVEQGAGASGIRGSDLQSLKVLWYPPAEQHAIARILGAQDDKIELNRRMNQTLEAMTRALFRSWFVDFDGVPQEDMQESGLGLIPKGWRVGTLGDVAEHPRRSVQPEEIEAATPYIALEHMPKRCIALADWGMGVGLESNKYEFKRGEILFGKLRPYFHKVGVAPLDGVCSTDIVVIAPKSPAWFGFVLVHASSDEFVEYTNAGSTGTKMPRTSWREMSRYAVVLPPESIAIAFNQQVQQMTEKIISNIHESRSSLPYVTRCCRVLSPANCG
jgi:type I restriction enzyme S subunit